MKKLKVFVTRRWPDEIERALAERFEVTLNQLDEPLSQDELSSAMADYDVLCPTVSDKIDGAVLNAGDRVRLIANYGVGFDHIDIGAAKAKGIAVSNTPGVLTDATADIAMTLLLMAARRAGEGERELREGRWTGWRPTHLLGSALKGKTLGLVGMGRIAIATAQRAHHGFGMKIAYYNRRQIDPEVAQDLGATFHRSLSDLLAASDCVSLHIPGGAETANLIDAHAIGLMKPGSYLINTARGGVLDHEALADALDRGHLAGAGLDVYPHEPEIPEALLNLENVVLLPHLGSANAETRIAMGMKALVNVEAFARGGPPPDRVV